MRSGVNGTPTFFVNGVRYDGAWDTTESLLAALSGLPAEDPDDEPPSIAPVWRTRP